MQCIKSLFGKKMVSSKFIRQNSFHSYVDTHVHFDAILKKLKKDIGYFPQFFNTMNQSISDSAKCEGIVHVSCSPSQKGIQDSLKLIKNENGNLFILQTNFSSSISIFSQFFSISFLPFSVFGAFGVHPHYTKDYTPALGNCSLRFFSH